MFLLKMKKTIFLRLFKLSLNYWKTKNIYYLTKVFDKELKYLFFEIINLKYLTS